MARQRLDSLDLLRGIVMVLMALDHVRDFFGPTYIEGQMATPEMVPGVGVGWFATRWITHFCAPVFVLTAGTSIFLFQSRGRSRGEVSRFLLTRGAWLIVLELTIVHLGWFMTDPYRLILFQVIWAIGAAMMVMAGLIWLPRRVVGALGAVIIVFHGVLPAAVLGASEPSLLVTTVQRGWIFLASIGAFPLVVDGSGNWVRFVAVNYPLLPWLGVMACGYALGPVMQMEPGRRVRRLVGLGATLTVGFVILRLLDVYGEPVGWRMMTGQAGAIPETGARSAVDTVIAFLNCSKYPPSLLFLMMTLGPALMALACFDVMLRRGSGVVSRFLITFGRVPLFFYVLHLFVIQLVVGAWALSRFGWEVTSWGFFNPPPPEYSRYGLWAVYGAWVVVVALTYPACRWFAGVKQRHRGWWVSYL